MNQLFMSGGQSTGASASTSVLPMNIQDWLPEYSLIFWSRILNIRISENQEIWFPDRTRMDWFDLAAQGTLKSLLQHHSLKASILQCSAFFVVQLSHPSLTSGKTIVLIKQTLVAMWCFCFLICYVGPSFSSKEQVSFNIMATVIICTDFGA